MVPVFYAYQEEKMAAKRLIALYVNKSKGASASMHVRIEYSQNPEKTEDGELITAYAWQPATAAEERGLCPVLHRAGTDEGSCQCEKK